MKITIISVSLQSPQATGPGQGEGNADGGGTTGAEQEKKAPREVIGGRIIISFKSQ